jgi:DNA-binding XRE family transcriptional regulator
MTETDPDIPSLVKELREQLRMTQEQFAQKVGVTYSTVNHSENRKRAPQPFLVRRLLELEEELDSHGQKSHRGKKPIR